MWGPPSLVFNKCCTFEVTNLLKHFWMHDFLWFFCWVLFFWLLQILLGQKAMMSNEEEKRCPLCAEEMDWTDLQFMPCKCGYQVMLCSTYSVLFHMLVVGLSAYYLLCLLASSIIFLWRKFCWFNERNGSLKPKWFIFKPFSGAGGDCRDKSNIHLILTFFFLFINIQFLIDCFILVSAIWPKLA